METHKYYEKLEQLIKSRAVVGGAIAEVVDADDAESLVDEVISDYDDLVKFLRDEIEKYETVCDKISRLLP